MLKLPVENLIVISNISGFNTMNSKWLEMPYISRIHKFIFGVPNYLM